MEVSAKIIKHTKSPIGDELITLEIELHRFILPEFNTHRVLSRNFQSSRAVPVEKMIDQVRNNPALPVHWGANQRGMVAENELPTNTALEALTVWKVSAEQAANKAKMMNELGVHKQIVNRLLEPFMWTKGVVTCDRKGWESFFKLRSHKDAQPEIKALSDNIKEAIDNSEPEDLDYNEWHLPYVDEVTKYKTIEDAIKVSVSCCAQVSYRVLDDSLDKAKRIYDLLNLPEKGVYKDDPPHFSPCEHVAQVVGFSLNPDATGNFRTTSYYQYRKMLERGIK